MDSMLTFCYKLGYREKHCLGRAGAGPGQNFHRIPEQVSYNTINMERNDNRREYLGRRGGGILKKIEKMKKYLLIIELIRNP